MVVDFATPVAAASQHHSDQMAACNEQASEAVHRYRETIAENAHAYDLCQMLRLKWVE